MGRHKGDGLTYTQPVADAICVRLAGGESLRKICRDEGMPKVPTVLGWVLNDALPFAEQYAHARDIGLDMMAMEILDVARDGSDDYEDKLHYKGNDRKAFNGEHVQRSKLIVDSLKWYVSKLAPKRYGDRLEVSGPGGAALQPILNVAIAGPGSTLESPTVVEGSETLIEPPATPLPAPKDKP